jgi:hypothetical protein
LLEYAAAKPVPRFHSALAVLSAVELDHQVAFFATEVRNEAPYRELPAESQSLGTPSAKLPPQCQFGIGLLMPQLTRTRKL